MRPLHWIPTLRSLSVFLALGAALASGQAAAQPAEWTCSPSYYDGDDGCDCECGAFDPDCDDPAATVYGCPTGHDGCNLLGTCRDVPTTWTCDATWFDAGDTWCDCDCGAYDPDCDRDTTLSGCPLGADACNPDGTCHVVPAEWTCTDSYFDDGVICDCDCGAYDPDCEDADAVLMGCPAGAESCNPDGTCRLVPAAWTCDETFFDASDGCDCDCGAYDPDCDDGGTLYGCDPGAFGCNADGTCDITPPTWTCSDAYFADGTFCDCDCGAVDPDCADETNTVFGCDPGAFGCNPDGTCDLTPPEWTCSDSWYLDGSFCDCGCGTQDPDCDDDTTTLFGCPNGATGCDADGVCILPPMVPEEWFCNPDNYDAGDGCDCGCGVVDPDCDAGGQLYGCPQGATGCDADGECIAPPTGPPPGWTCTATYYDAADGCDCECGVYDPDCDIGGATLWGCSDEATGCTTDGTCIEPGPVTPPGWTCAPANYDGGDGCHCECGVYDPDCEAPSQPLLNCPADAIGCSMDAECRVPVCTPSCSGKECGGDGCGGTCGTCGANETCTAYQCVANQPDVVPPTWSCSEAAYGNGASCNCECGAPDPDCQNGSLPVVGCQQGVGCAADGTCEEPEGPAAWTCDLAYYDAGDGCDCGCGAYDPDCALEGAELYGCTQGAEGCSATGECIGGAEPPPEGWTCGATYYDAGDGCDCGCGIYDPDCGIPDQQVFGCSQMAIGCNAAGECVEPACIPSCTDRECGSDGCSGSCGSCPGGETCDASGQCSGGGPDPEPGVEPDPEPEPVDPPEGWTCASSSYASGDGCHCGCGVYDPDCSDTGAAIVGCSGSATGCDLDGKCIEPSCTGGCGDRQCGTDECGMVCGICDASDFCSAEGTCLPRVVEEPGGDAGVVDGDGSSMSGCAACSTPERLPVELLAIVGLAGITLRRRRR